MSSTSSSFVLFFVKGRTTHGAELVPCWRAPDWGLGPQKGKNETKASAERGKHHRGVRKILYVYFLVVNLYRYSIGSGGVGVFSEWVYREISRHPLYTATREGAPCLSRRSVWRDDGHHGRSRGDLQVWSITHCETRWSEQGLGFCAEGSRHDSEDGSVHRPGDDASVSGHVG